MNELITLFADNFPAFMSGLAMSLLLLLVVVLCGTPLAALLAVGQRSDLGGVRWTSWILIEVGRGMPSLILLYLVYFGLPSVNISLPAFAAAAMALSINYAGYVSETVRSGLDAVPRGQFEAAAALGLSRSVIARYVLIPQSLRIVLPSLLSWIIVYFQTTSIGFAIAAPELMSSAYSIAATNFRYLDVFIIVGVLYAAISIPGSQLAAALERRAHGDSNQ